MQLKGATLYDTDENIVNRNEIRIVGMSRSGNHAIINWMLAQMPGRACYLNCVEPKTNPFTSARPLKDACYKANYDLDLEQERGGNFSRKDFLIYNYEDCFLGMVGSREFERRHDEFVGPSARRKDVLVLRDPFNLFASRRKGILPHVSWRTEVRIWKQHARAFLAGTSHLQHEPLVVSYNAWTHDRAYRERVARTVGLPFSDAGRERVAACGGGSSFDSLRFDGEAWRMDVFYRWKHFADEAWFRELFDDEMVSLTERLFEDLDIAARRPLAEAVARLRLRPIWAGANLERRRLEPVPSVRPLPKEMAEPSVPAERIAA